MIRPKGKKIDDKTETPDFQNQKSCIWKNLVEKAALI